MRREPRRVPSNLRYVLPCFKTQFQAFFENLDAQLNKVNDFYKRKEEEFVQRGSILDKQICALTGVKKLLEQGRIRQDEYGASGRHSELGTFNHITLQ